MHSRSYRSTAEVRHALPAQSSRPWKKLLAFLALIAIPAICTALYAL